MTKYKNKKSFIGLICIVLVVILSVGSLGFLSSGFRDWAVKDWFSGWFDKNEETEINYFDASAARFSAVEDTFVAKWEASDTLLFSLSNFNFIVKTNILPLDTDGKQPLIFDAVVSAPATLKIGMIYHYEKNLKSAQSAVHWFTNLSLNAEYQYEYVPEKNAKNIGVQFVFDASNKDYWEETTIKLRNPVLNEKKSEENFIKHAFFFACSDYLIDGLVTDITNNGATWTFGLGPVQSVEAVPMLNMPKDTKVKIVLGNTKFTDVPSVPVGKLKIRFYYMNLTANTSGEIITADIRASANGVYTLSPGSFSYRFIGYRIDLLEPGNLTLINFDGFKIVADV